MKSVWEGEERRQGMGGEGGRRGGVMIQREGVKQEVKSVWEGEERRQGMGGEGGHRGGGRGK